MKTAFESKNRKFEIVENPIDKAWSDRPVRPENPLEIMPVGRAGQSWQDKVANVRKEIKSAGCQGRDEKYFLKFFFLKENCKPTIQNFPNRF